MDDDVGSGHQAIDRFPVEHVTLAVLGLAQPLSRGIERATSHGQDLPDLAAALKGTQKRAADVAGRPGNRDGELPGRAAAPLGGRRVTRFPGSGR